MFSKLNKVVLLCCIHATFALFYCLLFNLKLNSYEFEFKLNVFESFQKWKSLPFSPLLFSPLPLPARFLFFFPRGPTAGLASLYRGPFLFLPAHLRARPAPSLPSLAATDRRAPPIGVTPFLESDSGPSPSLVAARRVARPRPARRGRPHPPYK